MSPIFVFFDAALLVLTNHILLSLLYYKPASAVKSANILYKKIFVLRYLSLQKFIEKMPPFINDNTLFWAC